MLPFVPGWLAVCAALVPPALKWWWGRALAARPDDPLLPERLQAQRRRTTGAFITATVLLPVLASLPTAASLVLLMAVVQMAAGYPLRRVLYGETWSLLSCMWFFARLIVAAFGLWIVLAATPWIVEAAGALQVPVAAAMVVFLVAWTLQSSMVLRRLMRARPIVDAALLPRFEALAAAAGLARPRFEYVAMNGGMLANAVALPSLRDPGVLFTDALLSRLTPDEAVAICGHELAHLEYYDRRRLRRQYAWTFALIVGAAAIGPMSRVTFGAFGSIAMVMWLLTMTIALALRARHRQENETASDLRAVTLSGNAEALASGLMKLHAMARVPRRWDQQREQQASHPSLARRIRDIRAHAQLPDVAIQPAVAFQGAAGTAAVTFEANRVNWQEAPGIVHVMDYEALVELRLHVASGAAPVLVAADRRQQRWQMTPRAADLAALQNVLDRVDSRLTREAPPRPKLLAVPHVSRIVVWVGALMAVQFLLSFLALGSSLGLDGDTPSAMTFIVGSLCVMAVCAAMGFRWLRRGNGLRMRWGIAAVVIVAAGAVLTVMSDLSRATAYNRDMFVAPATTSRVLSEAPAAIFDGPSDVRTLRLSPSGHVAAVARENGARVFSVAAARGAGADIEADDLAFIDDARAIALTVHDGTADVSEVDVASGTRNSRLRVPGIRSGSLTYRAAAHEWIVAGLDDSGRLARAAGKIGGTAVRSAAWPAPDGASPIDAWAGTSTGFVAVQNHMEARTFVRIWVRPAAGNPPPSVMPNTICVADAGADHRLLCAMQAGSATRIFALEAATGAWVGVATIDGVFRPGQQTASGWLIGWSGTTPAALRLATGELVQASTAPDDDEPSLLAVAGTMAATVTSGAAGSHIRVFRLGAN